MRYRYGRRTRGNPSFLRILIILAVVSSLGSILSLAGDLLDLVFVAIFMLVGLALMLGVVAAPFALIYIIFKALFGKNNNKKTTYTKTTTKTSTIDSDALVKQLSQYFNNNDIINIDEETYLTVTDKDNINLKTIDIFMREEYIGSLQDYLTAYPNAYNQLASMLTKYLSKKAKELKKKAKDSGIAPVENVAPEKKPTTKEVEKDADYYVKTLMYLNDQNPNEQITAGLNETCEFLRSLKKIEDEYPESKSKTVKLYQYYLPMLTDILANYNRLYANTTNQADFKASEDRLLKTIVLINGALKTISGGLLEDYYSEINVDMRTLESILKKDGLVEDFKQEG